MHPDLASGAKTEHLGNNHAGTIMQAAGEVLGAGLTKILRICCVLPIGARCPRGILGVKARRLGISGHASAAGALPTLVMRRLSTRRPTRAGFFEANAAATFRLEHWKGNERER